jgi:hypothetical protein
MISSKIQILKCVIWFELPDIAAGLQPYFPPFNVIPDISERFSFGFYRNVIKPNFLVYLKYSWLMIKIQIPINKELWFTLCADEGTRTPTPFGTRS